MPLKDVTELSDAEAHENGAALTTPTPTAKKPKGTKREQPEEEEPRPPHGPAAGSSRDGEGGDDVEGIPMKAMKAKAKAKAKQSMKRPSAGSSMKRPAASESKPVIKTHKSYYKKPQRFGIKVTPPGRELIYAP